MRKKVICKGMMTAMLSLSLIAGMLPAVMTESVAYGQEEVEGATVASGEGWTLDSNGLLTISFDEGAKTISGWWGYVKQICNAKGSISEDIPTVFRI